MKRKFWKRIFLVFTGLFLLLLICLAHPIYHLTRTYLNDPYFHTPQKQEALAEGKINDASHLDETNVNQFVKIPSDPAAAEAQLAGLLQNARTNHLKVSVAGARHSMGGHVIYPGGIAIDMLPFNRMELDAANHILHVQSGARWRDVIQYLNTNGLSVEVMQSNDDFSVGGSISVNCHGWQFDRPPIDSTVESFRVMLADGQIFKCSRTTNTELFSLVLGGYGLFGVILDVDLHVVPNERYVLETLPVASAGYFNLLTNRVAADPAGVAMVYGRLRLTKTNFLSDALLNIYWRKTPPPTNFLVSELGPQSLLGLKRTIFRGSVGSDYGKGLRWMAESHIAPKILSRVTGREGDRNQILSEPAEWFLEQRTNHTDILIECFVPPPQFEPFLGELQKIIPTDQADLLNLTIRHVNRDTNSFLCYADQDMIALVMLFNHTRDASGEAGMNKVTQDIVAAVLQHEGRYYLPYRLHPTLEQFHTAYPKAEKFFELKRKYDPEELFQNEFYLKYGK